MGTLSKKIRIIYKGELRDITSKVPPEPKLAFQTKSKFTGYRRYGRAGRGGRNQLAGV